MRARQIRRTASEWLDAPGSLIIPVPLARWRLWRRGYNQAGLIARALARDSAAALMLDGLVRRRATASRSEEHTSELQSLMRISYAVFCLKKKKRQHHEARTSNERTKTTHTLKDERTT